MAPGFELMGWLKQAGADAVPQAAPATSSAPVATTASGAPQVHQSASPAHNAPVAARLVPPHSQAAAALAAALSAGGVPEKKLPQPHGIPISPLQEVLDVDRSRPESTPNLVVSKIANVKSEISRRHGHAIAVDANYICYGLKGGQIRILNKHTGARTLLKHHAAPVTDLCFFRHDSERCLLASVDTAGQVHVRKVYEEDAGGEDTVRDELLARHTLPLPPSATQHTARLAWHPTYDFVLAVAVGPAIYLINVPPTADVAAAPEYAEPVAAAISTDGPCMTSVSFSPMGELLAAGDAAGYVYVWALSPEQLDPALIQPLAPEPDIRFQAYGSAPGDVPYGDGGASSALAAVVSLQWMPRGGVADAAICRPVGSIGGVSQTLLTGDAVNANLKLWSIDLSSKPQCTHALRLVASGGSAPGGGSVTAGGTASGAAGGSGGGGANSVFFNHMQAQPLYDCVVLANELRNHVYVLHVDFTECPDAPTFDYFSEFSVKMPILSYTMVPEAVIDEVTEADAFYMYTIQADAVQQYTLVPAQCFPLQPPTNTPLSAGGGAAGSTAGLLAATTSLPPHYHHHHHHLHPTASVGNAASVADAASVATHAARDPLAVFLALQQQHHQRQPELYEHASCPSPPPPRVSPAVCLSAASGASLPPSSTPLSPPNQPAVVACTLVSAPSDVSDATSRPPGLQLTSAFAVADTFPGAGAPASGVAALTAHGAAVPQQSAAVAAAGGEDEVQEGMGMGMLVPVEETAETNGEGEAEAVVEDAVEGEVEEGSIAAETAEAVVGEAHPAPPVVAASTAAGSRPAMLLTPSQLMQSAAAAAAAAAATAASRLAPGYPTTANGSSIGGGGGSGGGATEDAYSIVATAGRDQGTGSIAGTSRTQSLAGMSNMTPCLSEANLEYMAAAVAAAEEEEQAEMETAAAEAEAVDTAAESGRPGTAPGQEPTAITEAAITSGGGQHSPGAMPPLPSEQLVRRISQGIGGHPPLSGAQRPQSAPSPPHNYLLVHRPPSTSAESTPAPSRVTPAGSPRSTTTPSATTSVPGAAAAASAAANAAVAVVAAPSVDAVSQQQLTTLLALQQQLLDQMSASQRELLKVIRSEAQRSTKAVADAAASRAAEAVARKAAEDRRQEGAELQRAITAAINGMSKDISQRVADAAANTTTAIKAAIGPAVRAAVSEALPAALSTGATAAVLEQALGSQLATALPRAVADGLGAAFTAQVVPPLERATATMFGQMEIALRAGLDSHLAPLGPLAGLGGSLRDAATQVTVAAKSLRSEAAAAQQAAAAASRAATSAAAAAATANTAAPAAATVPSPGPATGGGKGAAKAAAAGGASKSATSEVASSKGGQGAQSSGSSQRSQQAATSAPALPPQQQQTAPTGPPPAAVANASSSATVKVSAPVPTAAPPAAAVPLATAPSATSAAGGHVQIDPATKEFIMGLIQAGDMDGALSRVLERQDLPLVLWTCSAAGGAAVLASEPCPLGQVTLLSLLTFLCFDLSDDVDLKLGWINGILKRLDVREPGMAPHMRGVLESIKGTLVSIARGGSGATAAKAKQAVHQAIGLIAMLS